MSVVEDDKSEVSRRATKDIFTIREVGPSTPTSAELTLIRGNKNVSVFVIPS